MFLSNCMYLVMTQRNHGAKIFTYQHWLWSFCYVFNVARAITIFNAFRIQPYPFEMISK